MKMTLFWDAAPCSLVEIACRFRSAYLLHPRPDDGASKHPQHVDIFLRDFSLHHLLRLSTSSFKAIRM
jgi:hypothetical protein